LKITKTLPQSTFKEFFNTNSLRADVERQRVIGNKWENCGYCHNHGA